MSSVAHSQHKPLPYQLLLPDIWDLIAVIVLQLLSLHGYVGFVDHCIRCTAVTAEHLVPLLCSAHVGWLVDGVQCCGLSRS